MAKITPEVEEEMVDNYVQAGASAAAIALEYGCSPSTVCRILQKRGIPLRGPGPPTTRYNPEELIADYQSTMPAFDVCRKHGITMNMLYQVLREFGVPARRVVRKENDEPLRQAVIEMYKQGVPVWKIYEETGVYPPKVYRWLREELIPQRNNKRIFTRGDHEGNDPVTVELIDAEKELVEEMKLQREERKRRSREDSVDKISGEKE